MLASRFGTRFKPALLILICLVSACSPEAYPGASDPYPSYDPFLPLDGTQLATDPNSTPLPAPTRTPGPTPTLVPLSVLLPTRDPITPLASPTPDFKHALPTPRADENQYIVEQGDTLGSIAERYGISVEQLMQANGLSDPNTLAIGQTLNVPPPVPGITGPSFKIIPDSELVYGPASAGFDLEAFITNQAGYLASYTQDLDDKTLTGSEIIALVSQNYSVNPRLLLALLEYKSRWVTQSEPASATLEYPLGLLEAGHAGLYRQLAWSANELNRGYYLWRAGAIANWVLTDGGIVPIDPTLNAGTAGVQNFFSKLDDRPTWENDILAFGLFQTYSFLFGSPFDLAIEPVVSSRLFQPRMDLPFERGDIWAFTGGPHAGWDGGSAWAALDFAPPDSGEGCTPSDTWVAAVAGGFIVRAEDGAVIEDLDGDGYEQTGWDVFYMHIESRDRVQPGTYVNAGDRIGHPSCEGGISNATHLHLARKYNGEWIPADRSIPFILGGWTSSGSGVEYDGFLKRGTATLEAAEGFTEINQIGR